MPAAAGTRTPAARCERASRGDSPRATSGSGRSPGAPEPSGACSTGCDTGRDEPRATARAARRAWRARLPGRPGLGLGLARSLLLWRDDEPAGGAAGGARTGRPLLVPVPGGRGARPRGTREGALLDRGRQARRGGPDALPRRPPLALPLEPVRLPAHL